MGYEGEITLHSHLWFVKGFFWHLVGHKKTLRTKAWNSHTTIEPLWRALPNISGHFNHLKPSIFQYISHPFEFWKRTWTPKIGSGIFGPTSGVPRVEVRQKALQSEDPQQSESSNQRCSLWEVSYGDQDGQEGNYILKRVTEKNHRDGIMLSDNPRGNPKNRGIFLLKHGIFHNFLAYACLPAIQFPALSEGSFANTSMFGILLQNDLVIGPLPLAKWRMCHNIPWAPSTSINDHKRLQDVGWT